MIFSLFSTLFFIVCFGYTLEMISGTVIMPRLWWLHNSPTPACIYCEEINKFIIQPDAYPQWEKREIAKWNLCIAKLAAKGIGATDDSRRPCVRALNKDWMNIGSHCCPN
jgi:hypothetical protein